MYKTDVSCVDRVLESLEPITRPDKAVRIFDSKVTVQFHLLWKFRPMFSAHVGKYQPRIFLSRVTGNFDFPGEFRFFGWRFNTLSSPVIFPSVIKAADAIPLDPTCMQQGQTVRAPGCDNIGFAVFTSVERQILAHDSNRCRFAGQQLGSQRNGLPKTP